ncbi:MAG: SH3 domain-containing protein [candidate division KSB1 bacterium]|nr:SH3 domain-containing protein [candidate division KSB1 bacterium]MDZ7367228.1 SH3 domain-containing protein [candidate division KSB1 bacterium]MDZ7405289.1 SH3 domain-containing protein [candidate division KSB1 bacterium]
MTWHEETARRQARNATWLAMLLSGAYLIYNVQDFHSAIGRVVARPYGYVIEIAVALLLASAGLLALNNGKKSGAFWLIVGGALLWYLSPLAFMITLPVPIAWMIARLVFKHYPTKTIWVFIIPLFACLGGWIGEQYLMEARRIFVSRAGKIISQTPPSLPQAKVIAPEGARLRAGPSTQAATVGVIGAGEVITILGEESGWYKVRHQQAGQTRIGYLYHTLAKVEGFIPPRAFPFVGEQESTLPPLPAEISGTMVLAEQQTQLDSSCITAGGKNIGSDLMPQSRHSLLGRWEGTLGKQLLLFVIESFEAGYGLGYSEARWTDSSPPLRMELQVRLNPATLEVTLTQEQKGSLVGTFTGTLSPDGNAMSGQWIFAEDSAQKFDWSVRRSVNVSIKN